MPDTLIAAVRRLADVLDRENAALRAMDLRRVSGLLAAKTAALAALAAFGRVTPGDRASIEEARRLEGLARENRQLLERGMAAQERVIGIVARAAASVLEGSIYAATGRGAGVSGPLALSTRA